MDMKSTFLNGFISEEVYVKQLPSFENEMPPHHVFKLLSFVWLETSSKNLV